MWANGGIAHRTCTLSCVHVSGYAKRQAAASVNGSSKQYGGRVGRGRRWAAISSDVESLSVADSGNRWRWPAEDYWVRRCLPHYKSGTPLLRLVVCPPPSQAAASLCPWPSRSGRGLPGRRCPFARFPNAKKPPASLAFS
jgi:hypothetical protein